MNSIMPDLNSHTDGECDWSSPPDTRGRSAFKWDASALVMLVAGLVIVGPPIVCHFVQCPRENYENCCFRKFKPNVERYESRTNEVNYSTNSIWKQK